MATILNMREIVEFRFFLASASSSFHWNSEIFSVNKLRTHTHSSVYSGRLRRWRDETFCVCVRKEISLARWVRYTDIWCMSTCNVVQSISNSFAHKLFGTTFRRFSFRFVFFYFCFVSIRSKCLVDCYCLSIGAIRFRFELIWFNWSFLLFFRCRPIHTPQSQSWMIMGWLTTLSSATSIFDIGIHYFDFAFEHYSCCYRAHRLNVNFFTTDRYCQWWPKFAYEIYRIANSRDSQHRRRRLRKMFVFFYFAFSTQARDCDALPNWKIIY